MKYQNHFCELFLEKRKIRLLTQIILLEMVMIVCTDIVEYYR